MITLWLIQETQIYALQSSSNFLGILIHQCSSVCIVVRLHISIQFNQSNISGLVKYTILSKYSIVVLIGIHPIQRRRGVQ